MGEEATRRKGQGDSTERSRPAGQATPQGPVRRLRKRSLLDPSRGTHLLIREAAKRAGLEEFLNKELQVWMGSMWLLTLSPCRHTEDWT